MKLKALTIVLVLVTLSGSAWGRNEARNGRSERVQKKEQSISTQPRVSVALCMLSGTVRVRGWDKNEVLARAAESAEITFKRGNTADQTPAARVDVIVVDSNDGERTRAGCQSSSDIELNVPRGATVQVQSRDGDIEISEVATAYVGSQNGNIALNRISEVSEVGSIGGDISVQDSVGRIDLNSIGGTVAVNNVRPADPRDTFEISTVSGDVELLQVRHSHLNVRTVNGNMKLTGPLQPNGRYGVNTMSGDVTFALPADASFRLSAKVSSGGDIITDFPLTLLSQAVSVGKQKTAIQPKTPNPPMAQPVNNPRPAQPAPKGHAPTTPAIPAHPSPAPTQGTQVIKVKPSKSPVVKVDPAIAMTTLYTLRRVNAVCGTGDALISVASFSGTLHLQKN